MSVQARAVSAEDVPVRTESDEAFDFRPYLDGAGFLAGQANVIMQLAVPEVGYGVVESKVTSGQAARRPFKRSRTTFTYLAVALGGTEDERRAYRLAVNESHRQVRSDADSPVKYNAFDPKLQLWVAACIYKGYADVNDWLRPDTTEAEKDAFYQASAVIGTGLQMRRQDWPADRAAFQEYWDEMVRERVRIDPPVRDYLLDVMGARHFPMPIPQVLGPVFTFFTKGWLPQEFRDQMGIEWGAREQRRFEAANVAIRSVESFVPGPLRRLPWLIYLYDFRLRRRFGMKLA